MSSKVSKGQANRTSLLAVQSIDSMDDHSPNSVYSPSPVLSYKPQSHMLPPSESPSVPRKKRRQTYSGPSTASINEHGNDTSDNGSVVSVGSTNNPHQKYSRTLGHVSDAQSQTTLLVPPKLKNRAKSFSAGDIFDAPSGGNSGKNSRRSSNSGQGSNNNNNSQNANNNNNLPMTLSRANSRSLTLSARKKRVTFRNPIVDDRLDNEASRKFSRTYSGNGGGFFGLPGRSTSQSRIAGMDDDNVSVSSEDNSGSGSKKKRGHKRGKKDNSNNKKSGNGGDGWFLSFCKNLFRSSKASKSSRYATSSTSTSSANDSQLQSSSVNEFSTSNGESSNNSGEDNSVMDFAAMPQLALESGKSTNDENGGCKNKTGNNQGTVATAPTTPRTSVFFSWRSTFLITGTNASKSNTNGGNSSGSSSNNNNNNNSTNNNLGSTNKSIGGSSMVRSNSGKIRPL